VPIELCAYRLGAGASYREICFVKPAREYAGVSRSRHETLISAGIADSKAELALGEKTDVCSMPSPPNVWPGISHMYFQQKAGSRREALVRTGALVAGTICPPTMPVIRSISLPASICGSPCYFFVALE
jgi:hypothetical protein